jgi:histidine ammonia-lyase
MGSIAAHKLLQVLKNASTVLAIELMVAAQALDMARPHPKTGKPMVSGKGVEAAHRAVRERIPRLRQDRVLSGDIAAAVGMLEDGSLLGEVVKKAGTLK